MHAPPHTSCATVSARWRDRRPVLSIHEVQRVRSATIKDVAERAGVSLKTVSRVINNEPSVHARTRETVQREIDALGYQPDPSARSLRSTRAYALGLVYDNPNAHYI